MIPDRSKFFIFTFITCLSYAASRQSSVLAYPTLAQFPPQQSILENTTANGQSNSIVVAQAYPGVTDMPTLNRGSKGEKVGELQTQLKQLGFYDGPVDKSYGEKLQFAVAKFQNAVGLTADGVTTPATWQWLQIIQSQNSTAVATPTQPKQTTSVPTSLQPTPQPTAVATPTQPTQQTTLVPTPLQPTPQPTAVATPTQPTQKTTSSVQEKSSSEMPVTSANTTQIAQNPNSSAVKTVATESDIPRWVWLLIGFVFTVIGVGGGIYLFMKLFGYEPFEEENQAETYISPPPPPRSRRVEPPTPRTKKTSPKNSYPSSTPRVVETISIEPQPKRQAPTEAIVVEQTTRLPKININDELIKDLREPNKSKQRKAIWELAQQGDSRAVQPLLDLMIDSDSTQRSLIIDALSQIGIRTLKHINRAFAISLEDENAEVRKNTIRDLTRVYESLSQINQLLLHAADDEDSEVQETAEWALSQLNRIRVASGVENGQLPNYGNSTDNSAL
ncbi:Peptidoglycan-binding domain 1 protein [Crinalium epipsammum PCC 9333]|uniref:Peptidoglycan-binding domain 1 protein n=1 Tax=Crinalium epipsammum PCC 9333 TaxID=1173022 RepID=K9VZ79_9CYAN|nr:peptidoglycan-binding protein [Crinalium epipsammum]AFZ13433.1 Peptidoglycan-binding domain 1 protein [Crinalium epipsammum PCC 9333]